METFRRLETPKLWAIFRVQTISDDGVLSDSTLTNPDTTIKAIIMDSTGAVVQALADMAQSGGDTGKYYYQGYTIIATAKTGIWHWEARGTDTNGVAIGKGSFIVVEQIA